MKVFRTMIRTVIPLSLWLGDNFSQQFFICGFTERPTERTSPGQKLCPVDAISNPHHAGEQYWTLESTVARKTF